MASSLSQQQPHPEILAKKKAPFRASFSILRLLVTSQIFPVI
ncbi:hypothetical protein MC28_G106 (plasmid) [Bacillus thuringiensis MC28]|nr:hypothetical protein MC28_G106 [Bacillus thuringiensis MC28]